jgi:hypothetical protein
MTPKKAISWILVTLVPWTIGSWIAYQAIKLYFHYYGG